MEIFKEFTFDAAHWLPNVPEGHKCRRLHGHTYRVRVSVAGDVDPHTGFVIDFGDLKAKVKPLIDQLDHSLLNDIVINPTAENITNYLWECLSGQFNLTSIETWETPTSGAKRAVFG